MFVYLDESGDTGFKFKQKSSRYFVITLVVVEDPFFINEAVDKLRDHLGYDYDPEFHFFSTKPEIREQFLFAIRDLDFVVRALVIDKQRLTSPQMRKRETFYNSFVRLLLQHDNGTIDDAILVLDASVKSKRIQGEMGTYLRRMLNSGGTQKISKISHHNSRNDNLIQATDMICGAIYARYNKEDDRYYRIIRRRVQDLWEFEPGT
ncbi:MAG: DUF3800 domain-containing protein [Chloroflexota bacterium]|nr:DUF3800 domain-containing protein [Chloroflexota bacterium]